MNFLLQRLTDNDILRIFEEVQRNEAAKPRDQQDLFLSSYAEALRAAPRRDFMILRPTALILIGKYNLASCLVARSNSEVA